MSDETTVGEVRGLDDAFVRLVRELDDSGGGINFAESEGIALGSPAKIELHSFASAAKPGRSWYVLVDRRPETPTAELVSQTKALEMAEEIGANVTNLVVRMKREAETESVELSEVVESYVADGFPLPTIVKWSEDVTF